MPAPTAQQVHIDYALSNLSVAYLQEAPPISDRLFPRVPVDFQSNKYFLWSKGDFFRDDARKRAPGDDFAQMKLGLTTDSYFADQYALEYPIYDEVVANEDAAVRLRENGTRVLTAKLMMRKDRAFAADFCTTSVWGTDITGVASAPGTSQVLQWNDAASDPAGDLQTAMETILNATGEIPGLRMKLLIGSAVRAALVNHPDAIDRIKYVQRADVAAVDGILGSWLGVDELVVARKRYTTSAEGVTDTFSAVIGKVALLVAVPDSPALEMPSAGYTFEWNEGGKGPMYVESYRYEPKKADILRGITHFDQKVVASSLGYFWNTIVA